MLMYKLLMYALRFVAVLLVSLVPKNKKVWVFGAWFGQRFSDNSKYLYKYVSDNEKNINPIWITKSKKLTNELITQGINAFYYKSPLGIYYQIRAGVVMISHSMEADLNSFFIGLNTYRVQLWHGIPLKKIGFDNDKAKVRTGLSIKFPKLYMILMNSRYDMMISTGDLCSKIFSSAFNLPISKIKQTGFPRNDVFFKRPEYDTLFKIVYMPTFRDVEGDSGYLFTKYGFNALEFDKKLKAYGIILYIRVHPANRPSSQLIETLQKCDSIRMSESDDIYEEINQYNCLITDYSSIMFDFILSGRNVIFAPFDLKEYLSNNRNLYFDYYNLIHKDGAVFEWETLIEKIIKLRIEDEIERRQDSTLLKYHDVFGIDKYSFSKNTYEEIKNLIK